VGGCTNSASRTRQSEDADRRSDDPHIHCFAALEAPEGRAEDFCAGVKRLGSDDGRRCIVGVMEESMAFKRPILRTIEEVTGISYARYARIEMFWLDAIDDGVGRLSSLGRIEPQNIKCREIGGR
jgi:hypothetical protein